MDEAHVSFRVYRDRLRRLSQRTGIAYGMLFKNCRPGAGASIEHVHSQLIGTPEVPSSVCGHIDRCRQYHQVHGRYLGEDLVNWELESGTRIVAQTDHFVAFCPYASHLAFETWIFPRARHRSFLDTADSVLQELSELVWLCTQKSDRALNGAPYNFAIHLTPFDSRDSDYYQWHVELSPRLTKLAGFEWGTGCMILPVAPETAAQRLRDA